MPHMYIKLSARSEFILHSIIRFNFIFLTTERRAKMLMMPIKPVPSEGGTSPNLSIFNICCANFALSLGLNEIFEMGEKA